MHFIRSHPLAKKLFLNLVALREGENKETLLKCLKMIEVNAATLVVRRKKEENSSKFVGQRVSIFISIRKVVLRISFQQLLYLILSPKSIVT